MSELPINQVLCGDCLEVMQSFPKESVDLVMFSPPYWGLRDYGVDGQIGLEKHPNDWIAKMVEVCGEVKRVLKKSGSMYLNVGDTYCGSHAGYGDYRHANKRSISKTFLYNTTKKPQGNFNEKDGWLQPKQKLLMPSRLAIALQHEGWILRNDIIWHKPNHMPSSVKDRLTCAYEHIFHMVKARRYFYDLDAIRQPHKQSSLERGKYPINVQPRAWRIDASQQIPISGGKKPIFRNNPLGKNPSDIITRESLRQKKIEKGYLISGNVGGVTGSMYPKDQQGHPKGKNPSDIMNVGVETRPKSKLGVPSRFGKGSLHPEKNPRFRHKDGKNPSDFWSINTKPFPQAHFAVYPEAIYERPIKSSCPHAVCRACGKPKTRIVKTKNPSKQFADYENVRDFANTQQRTSNPQSSKSLHRNISPNGKSKGVYYSGETVGWSDCGCKEGFDAGIVLDPMCGAGTTLVVAQKLGRRWIGIDLKAEYVEMAKKRLRKECSEKLVKWS